MGENNMNNGMISYAEVCEILSRTRSGVDKIRARDETFPDPFKFSESRQAAVYFKRDEFMAWIESKRVRNAG